MALLRPEISDDTIALVVRDCGGDSRPFANLRTAAISADQQIRRQNTSVGHCQFVSITPDGAHFNGPYAVFDLHLPGCRQLPVQRIHDHRVFHYRRQRLAAVEFDHVLAVYIFNIFYIAAIITIHTTAIMYHMDAALILQVVDQLAAGLAQAPAHHGDDFEQDIDA